MCQKDVVLLLCSIPVTVCLSFHLLMDVCVVSSLGLLQVKG